MWTSREAKSDRMILNSVLIFTLWMSFGIRPMTAGTPSGRDRRKLRSSFWANIDGHWLRQLEERGMRKSDTKRLSSTFMLELYDRLHRGLDLRQATGHWKDTIVDGDTVRSLPAKVNVKKLRRQEMSLAFNITTILRRGPVKLAELRLRPNRQIRRSHRGFYRIFASLRNRTNTKRSRKFIVPSFMDYVNNFYCLNLTSVVERWEQNMDNGDTMEITLLKPKRRQRNRAKRSPAVPEVTSSGEQTYVNNEDAILFVLSEEGKLFRSQLNSAFRELGTSKKVKRRAGRKNRKNSKRSKWKQAEKQKKQCKKYDFRIDFNTLGWGKWIIEPKVFNARFCYGVCSLPLSRRTKPTNHAMMQGLMMSKGTDTLGSPCCVPTRLRPLSMLYYEDGEIVVRHHRQMVVSECGCR